MCERQHKVAEVACYQIERDTDRRGSAHPISVLELTETRIRCERLSRTCADILVFRAASVAMQPEYRTEGPKLEPPHNQLSEGWLGRVAVAEAANVSGPKVNAAHCDVLRDLHLNGKLVERRFNVA